MSWLIDHLATLRIFKGDIDNHLVRASKVIIYFFFGYQKWFDYEAQGLIPFFTHGPLIFWMYPVFGINFYSMLTGNHWRIERMPIGRSPMRSRSCHSKEK